ncbi:MAG: M67 family metallopeptidase [Phycisphaerae bacterium]|nr:M67 family metallopeptidase [Phycisphaerae bacterium]
MNRVSIQTVHLEAIVDHARACLPAECCGILIGLPVGEQPPTSTADESLQVSEVHPVRNIASADQSNHYKIDPLDHLRLQRTARERGLRILGFYHSHPQGPAEPSIEDMRRPWAGYAYLVIAPGHNANNGSPPAISLHTAPDNMTANQRHSPTPPSPGPWHVRCWEWNDTQGLFTEIPLRVADATT